MLTALSVRDVVLIEALDLEFGPGLLALTGETGAGKSILLDALGLALGGRGEAGLVRTGTPTASVTAEFAVAADHPARALLAENGLEATGPILLRRTLKADGGGRAFAQDVAVGVGLLRELGGLLVEIHGQHDERGLLRAQGHRDLLDQFGGHEAQAADVAAAWQALAEARARETAHATDASAAEREREWLEHAVEELGKLKPEPGEEATLAEERAAMQKGARLAGDIDAVFMLLGGSDGALAQLRQASRRLERIGDEQPELGLALAALDRAGGEGAEAEQALEAAANALAFDPMRMETVETRLFELRALARKHRVDPDTLAQLAEDLAAKLEAITDNEGRAARLAAEVARARATYITLAQSLTTARTAAAARLDTGVAAELAPLKLDTARFRVALAPLPEAQWGAGGQDRAEFEIATNPGAPFAPLIRIASGGELSRFTLALKVALAATRQAATLIFDEIDRGVGGAVASAIGERLARLAAETQVLVVTHSPQVAAAAARQWRIAKAAPDGRAVTGVVPLTATERREEIARMLSGAQVTAEARAQAGRLLGGGDIGMLL